MVESVPLDYGRPPRRASLKTRLIVVGLVAGAIAMFPLGRVVRSYVSQYRIVRVQARLLAQQEPADRVVFAAPEETSPEETRRRLLADEMHVIGLMPVPAFVHGRTSANGTTRLVAVWPGWPWLDANQSISAFEGWTYLPITWTPGSRLKRGFRTPAPRLEIPRDRRWAVYAGQADTADAARFTIGYAVGDERGTIAGRLLDDGSIEWTKLDGPGEWQPGR